MEKCAAKAATASGKGHLPLQLGVQHGNQACGFLQLSDKLISLAVQLQSKRRSKKEMS